VSTEPGLFVGALGDELPTRISPFEFTENVVCRAPTNQKSNPMGISAETALS
jgi:hypothetical protein